MGKVKIGKNTYNTEKLSESARNKNQVISTQNDKTCKRKNKLKIMTVKKKIKISSDNEEESNDDIREPTLEELKESEKPVNIFKVKSGRKKKKEKYVQKLEHNKLYIVLKDINRNKEYLIKWKEKRSEWKFEKLRQISIQLSMFDEDKISEKLWPIALDYLSSSKGQSKNKIIELAEMQISKSDKEIEETEKHDIINNISYRRAREILQSFD